MSERLLSEKGSEYRKQQYAKYLEETVARLKTDRKSVFAKLNEILDLQDVAEDPVDYMSNLIELIPVDYGTWLQNTLQSEAHAEHWGALRPELTVSHTEDNFYSEMDEDQADVMRHIDRYAEESMG